MTRTRLNLRQLYLYLVIVFTFVLKLLKQASHCLNDNGGISLNSQAVFFFFFNFQTISSRRKIIYTFYLFGAKTERNEVSKRKL